MAEQFFATFVKFFFLLTPFFVLSVFLSLTREETPKRRRWLALQTALAVILIALGLFFCGNHLFRVFGITLDAFRVGTGALLFLSAVDLVRGAKDAASLADEKDFVVVPLAIPVTIGPATTGALLVMGAEAGSLAIRLVDCGALAAAVAALGLTLYASAWLEQLLHRRGIVILSKLTGLVLAALAAQIVLTGVQGFFATP